MKVFSLLSLVCCAVLAGCGIPDTAKEQDNSTAIEVSADTARTSLDWNGIYKGTVPCSDCEGTQVLLELKQDGTYMQSFSYIGKVSADAIDFQILRADGSAAPLASHTLRAAGG